MSKYKKGLVLLLALSLLLSVFTTLPTTAEEITLPPSISAQSAVLIEGGSGDTVYSKNADMPLPMASTTKIMTALVAAELAPLSTPITVDVAAVGVEGSSVYLTAGEVLSLEQLLYALMLESANDAAVAIAIGLCGSVEQFAVQMNHKAQALGLQHTHFVNPHGLDDENHYTTARELAKIAQALLQNTELRAIVSTRKTTIPHAESEGGRLLVNHNKMLRLYEGCAGVKTGFTKKSGRCLVSAAERDGVLMIAVTLNAPDDWNDHTAMLDYGFTQYRSVTLCEKEEYRISIAAVGGAETEVTVCNPDALRIVLPASHEPITQTVEIARFVYAPIANGEILGKVVFRCDADRDGSLEVVGEAALIACSAVEKQVVKKSFWQWLCALFGVK